MCAAPVVCCETSAPPTTPRGTKWSGPGLTTCIARKDYSRIRLSETRRTETRRSDARVFSSRRVQGDPSARHPRELPAGDVQHLAMDEVRPRRAEEEHAAGGLLRRAGPPERDDVRRHPAHLLGDAELHRLAADL